MLVDLACQILFPAAFILYLPNVRTSAATEPVCQQIYMRPPRIGQRCVTNTEVYRNHTTVSQERCMWHCLQASSCAVVNYNIAESSCLLGHAPCVSLEPERDFVTILMTMQGMDGFDKIPYYHRWTTSTIK